MAVGPPPERIYADWTTHPISGYARAAMEQGKDGHFSCPLISHIEGNLWSGGCVNNIKLGPEFKHVISLYPWEKFRIEPETKRTEFQMYDSGDLYDDLNKVADVAYEAVQDGQTLIHCQAGLNRSGLTAALVLRRMGRTSQEAIDLLREKRSPMVLCNKTFENYLLALDYKDELTELTREANK
jgi:protein-tyrosine phosphatase